MADDGAKRRTLSALHELIGELSEKKFLERTFDNAVSYQSTGFSSWILL